MTVRVGSIPTWSAIDPDTDADNWNNMASVPAAASERPRRGISAGSRGAQRLLYASESKCAPARRHNAGSISGRAATYARLFGSRTRASTIARASLNSCARSQRAA